jgi:hypothetical protein
MKACGFFQRLVVMIAGDDTGTYYKLDVKSQGLFGESHAATNKYNIRDYAKFISNRGVDAANLVTRLSFDTDASVPKLLFSAVGFVGPSQFELIKKAVGSEEVKRMLEITMNTVDLSAEEDLDDAATAPTETVTPASTNTAAPATSAPPAPQAETAPAQPKQYKGVKEKLGEFTVQDYLNEGWTKEALLEGGYIVEVLPEPPKPKAPPAPPVVASPPKPSAPKPTPPPAATQAAQVVVETVPIPAKATAAAPVTEVADDAELQEIIKGLI